MIPLEAMKVFFKKLSEIAVTLAIKEEYGLSERRLW